MISVNRISHLLIALFAVYWFSGCVHCDTADGDNLMVFTVATELNDGFQRFMRSADAHGYKVTVLGRGTTWLGGDVLRFPGGGQKVNLLREALKSLHNATDSLVMFVDSYDVVFTAGPNEIVKAFRKFDADIVFSAEAFCWPDIGLADKYPDVKPNEKRFLNSGGYIGYAQHVAEMLVGTIQNTDDDQLYFTKIFLDSDMRAKLKIKLDTKSMIFQNLNGALDEVTVKFQGASGYLYNFKTGFTPMVIHGNGPIKSEFNSLTNYLVSYWTPKQGCLACQENTFNLDLLQSVDDFPMVFLAVFIEYPTAFLEDCLQLVADLEYPKKKIDLFIHYVDHFHEHHVINFVSANRLLYNSISVHGPDGKMNNKEARNRAMKDAQKKGSAYLFSVDSDIQLENTRTLHLLIQQNRSVIAPMIVRPGKTWSNFWGAISRDGFYERSADYMEIVKGLRVGLWNIPYMRGVYLVHGRHIPSLIGAYGDGDLDCDMAFCKKLRELSIFMYVDNRVYYGHMTDSENYETTHLHNDLYAILDNQYTWERKYLHPDYFTTLYKTPFAEIQQPCPDVFWFPMVKPVWCQHLIEEMENYGQWSGGKNEDPRLAGGYENVPTVDIHLRQIGLEKHWLFFLRQYIVPYSGRAFEGYQSEGRSIMNFVVRYRPGEQDHLRPHDDASTFSILITLNTPGVDFQGGGTRYIRYNCSITNNRVGWMAMHPGRLTHRHEGLKVTSGTRYIMVAFVDP